VGVAVGYTLLGAKRLVHRGDSLRNWEPDIGPWAWLRRQFASSQTENFVVMTESSQIDQGRQLESAPVSDFSRALLLNCISRAQSRMDLWVDLVRSAGVRRMAEVGVYRGDFAARMLRDCESVIRYYMLDPWRHLDDWNKPANHEDAVLAAFLEETKTKTEFAASKRVILRGKTTEVVDQVADGELDFAYIDADHTLKGIAIDLIRLYPKVRVGGLLGGDDFTNSMWEHRTTFEPTLVFPYAVYFAEAVGLSGHPKTGQWWSGQNRPTGRGRGLSCSTLQPAVEASPFLCANSVDRI
jgi:predicted O-methyltransferase YrrM